MSTARPPAFLAILTLAAITASGCSTQPGERDGPPFDVAFPDASALVTTLNPDAVRRTLATVQLPNTQAHHDQLLSLLESQSRIPAGNLVLLVEAVAIPEGNRITCSINGDTWVYAQRGKGEFSPIADELIAKGTDKLVEVDRASLGALIGRTQTNQTMTRLAERFVPKLDDGSPDALREILEGMPCSPASVPFVAEFMIPTGRLEGERSWQCVELFSLDSQRLPLIEALAKHHETIDSSHLLLAVEAMDFDSARKEAIDALASKLAALSPATATRVATEFDFDKDRQHAVATMAATGKLKLTEAELLAIAKCHSFDEARHRSIESLAPCLKGAPNGASARELLNSFSFDKDRTKALKVLAPRWRKLSQAERQTLAATFDFDSAKAAATETLR